MMKKLILCLFIGMLFTSCDKKAFQQTTDQIKSADSLLSKANDGLKTLDSISKTISKPGGIIPQIEKHGKKIDSTMKAKNWSIDSINEELKKITGHVGNGTDVIKTVDSAQKAIDKGENPLDVLTKTADKLLKKSRSINHSQNPTESTSTAPSADNSSAALPRNPLIKKAKLEVEVDQISDAQNLIQQKLKENKGQLTRENLSQIEGVQTMAFEAKVPLSEFDRFVDGVSNLGQVRMKSTVSEGMDYFSDQPCSVEITLVQNEKISNPSLANDDANSSNDSTLGAAFMKGFQFVKDGLVVLLPFWPLFVIAVLVWYFISNRGRKKIQKELEEKQSQVEQKNASEPVVQNLSEENTPVEMPKTEDTDYSKYMPKK